MVKCDLKKSKGVNILGRRQYPFCKMNIQPPPSSFRMDKRNTFLEKKAQRRRERRRGDRDDDERQLGAKQRTTMRTRNRGELEREAVPQLDPQACWRDGGEEGDDDERRRGCNEVGKGSASRLRAQVSGNY
jgi:hypothetical protein